MKWRIGDVTITRVVELTSSTVGNYILPQATEDRISAIDWIGPFVDDDHQLVLSFHSLVIETEDQILIVDTCIGNDKERTYPKWNRMQSSYLQDLAAAGFETDNIETVLCTHMHVDHVGWNTRLLDGKWQATFPNARYLYAEDEWRHWQNENQAEYGPVIDDSVRPIFDAGLADLVSSDHRVTSDVRLESTPGHTPGHVSVHITSRGEEAVTRARFLDSYADRPVLVIGTHFAGPTAGKLVRDGDSYRLDY